MVLHRDLWPGNLLSAEIAQRRDEGYQVGDLPERIDAAITDGTIDQCAEAFWTEIESWPPMRQEVEWQETLDLESRRAAITSEGESPPSNLDETALYNRIYGAWLGRCAGCTLGKPVEGWLRPKIEAYLRAADAYPLASYFPILDPFPEGLALASNYTATTLGHVRGMTRDDDIDYTVLGLHILETYTRDFSTRDVAEAWINNLLFAKVYTAEAVTFRNLTIGLEPPHTARHRNPYREWIGAQIRADMWGYVNPGQPQRAAAFALRDASLSHVRNGVYGAMWASACLATALVTDDLEEIIAAGLAQIPEVCRLARAVQDTLTWARECSDWADAWDRVNAKYGGYPRVHVINNTCAIVLGLFYGAGDLEDSICLAVMGGWDTDCTGATVGSIVGAVLGADALPEKWTGPLNDRLESIIPAARESSISDLARRTVAQAQM